MQHSASIVVRRFLTLSSLAAALAAQSAALPAVPEKLRPSSGEVLSLEARARGVQVYKCDYSKTDATRFDWVLTGPDAVLIDGTGRTIGRHYAGPTWESTDGSKVSAEAVARDDGPDAGSIPWLLLKARSTSGSGVFGRTTSIQRAFTLRGKPPAEACGPERFGQEARMPYRATYFFYAARP